MSIDELEDLKSICDSMYAIEALEDAIKKQYWIKFSTPFLEVERGQIYGGELGDILRKHLIEAIKEMNEYIENISVGGIYDESNE